MLTMPRKCPSESRKVSIQRRGISCKGWAAQRIFKLILQSTRTTRAVLLRGSTLARRAEGYCPKKWTRTCPTAPPSKTDLWYTNLSFKEKRATWDKTTQYRPPLTSSNRYNKALGQTSGRRWTTKALSINLKIQLREIHKTCLHTWILKKSKKVGEEGCLKSK